jgi:hypothetical protein
MLRRLALLVALTFFAACSAPDPGTAGGGPVALALAPVAIEAGDSLVPTVNVTVDGITRPAISAEIRVTSSDTGVIVVAPNGALVAVGDGQADITISWVAQPGVSVTRTISVTTEILASVAVTGPATMVPGDTAAWVVSGTVHGGHPVANPTSVTLSSNNPGVLSLDGTTAVAAAPGSAWIVVRAASGATDSLLVTVAVGAPAHLTLAPHSATIVAGTTTSATATLSDRRGNPVTGVTPLYTSTAPAIAVVQADGTIIGVAAGSASVIATAGAASDTMQVTVTPAPVTLAQLIVTPDSVQLTAGGSVTLQVQGVDNLGHAMTPPALTWQSFTQGITVSSSGQVQTSASITTQISNGMVQVSSGAVVAQVRVVVVPPSPVLAQLVVTPDSVMLVPGGSVTIGVQALDTHGAPMTLPALTWQSFTSGITVSASGLIQASASITTQITNGLVKVSSGSITAPVRVVVTPGAPALAQLIPLPDSITLSPGSTATISVQAFDTHGQSMTVPALTWQSLTSGITVGSNGVVLAASTITTTIPNGVVQVSSGTITAQVRVAVVVPPPVGDNGYVQIRWVGSQPSAPVAAAFEAARVRLNGLFLSFNGVLALNPNLPANFCMGGAPALNETVNGIVIFAQVTAIDGVGGILGSAGPCIERTGTFLPIVGSMQFDSADMNAMVANGLLNKVVLHEMMHTLGFGTIWGPGNQDEVASPNGADPRYLGASGQAGYAAIGGTDGATGVPVENTGGSGTRGSHWREASLYSELMTGWADGAMPMSRATVGALRDFGYDVDVSRADPFTLPAGLQGSSLRAPGQQIGETTIPPLGMIGTDGRITPMSGLPVH